jgi:hypothetical protein
MSFNDSADMFSYALGFLAQQHMNAGFDEEYQINHDSWNKTMFDAHQALNELAEMGQGAVINASFWSVANATFFFSPFEQFSDHQDMLDEVFHEVINYGDVAINDSDEDEDQVFEFTADKEHLMNCLGVELAN